MAPIVRNVSSRRWVGGGRDRLSERDPRVGESADSSVFGIICRFVSPGGRAIDQLGVTYPDYP